jgi:FAD/FMN-containing dehydrogenase
MLRGCGEAKAVATDYTENTDRISPVREYLHKQNTNIVFKSVKSVSSVVYPESTEELSEIMKRAFAERWTVSAAGGMALLERTSSELIVHTNRLNQIVEHEPADLIAIAQAGVTLTAFNQKLAENGQWLPLDPPDDGRATLGGIVATGLGGAQQFGYGRPRGSVVGMTVVLADGSIIKAGGRVVKNVAGYDLCKLFTGSYGTLGVITELIFKLRPRPAREATVIATGAISDLFAAGHTLINARLFPVAVELVSSAFSKRIGIATDEATLLVRFAGNDKGVAYQVEQALVHLKNSAVKTTELRNDDAQLWQWVAAIPLQEPPSFATRVLPTQLGKTISALSAERLWQAGVGDGRIRTAGEPRSNTEAIDSLSQPINSLSQRVKQQLDPFNLFRGPDHEHAA